MIEYITYSVCAFVPILSLYAVFMILTERWKVKVECGERDDCNFDCENCDAPSAFFFKNLAD